MEYFVDMTTHVPDGTPKEAVDAVRSSEAVRAAELAAEGHLQRLWRPPTAPGEWRTFGLFAADGDRELDGVLASMPLHVWRTDQVTPLAAHPNDPATIRGREPSEFLTTLTITVPDGTPARLVDKLKADEAVQAALLAEQGRLVRLWTPPNPPGEWRTLGLWSAGDPDELATTLESLPLHVWMSIETTPLSVHPNDPVSPVGSQR
jgi:muconolactone delta-isomerase